METSEQSSQHVAVSGEELLSVFSRKEPNKLQLAETITQLTDENARLRRDQRRLQAYTLGKKKTVAANQTWNG